MRLYPRYTDPTFAIFVYILWVKFCSSVPTPNSGDDVAIIGGEEAKPHEFPYLVDIRRFSMIWMRTVHACSGVIIHPQWILTAAHCIANIFSMYIVVAGKNDNSPFVSETSQRKVPVRGLFIPEGYELMVLKDDIALLRLGRPLAFNEFVKSIRLPKPGFVAKGIAAVAGWGIYKPERSSSNLLMKLNLPIVSKNECLEMYGQNGTEQIFNTSLCAGYLEGGRDACDGNSGGGLFCDDDEALSHPENKVLCGILSWGRGCALPKTPMIFTNVSCFLGWINDTITLYT